MFAPIAKVISLKWVQHKTNPKNVTKLKNKKANTPDFQENSCSI
jgi:hypothetical protein